MDAGLACVRAPACASHEASQPAGDAAEAHAADMREAMRLAERPVLPPICAGCGKSFFIGLRPAHTHCRSCDPAHYEALAKLPPVFSAAERYAFVRRLSPVAFADLWAANIRGDGAFDDLVDAGIAAERATVA